MCQGVIVSLVKFKAKGKNKTVVLSGIGSHSDMLAKHKQTIIKAGWKVGKNESIISIESDFSKGYGNFTVESGTPTKKEMALLKKEYNRCAGSTTALIAHVKTVSKIDDALISLLTAKALADYEAKCAPLYADYEAKCAPLYADYKAKRATLYADYEAKRATLDADYEAKCATHWIALFSIKENRLNHLQ
jgi:hypothetical protein